MTVLVQKANTREVFESKVQVLKSNLIGRVHALMYSFTSEIVSNNSRNESNGIFHYILILDLFWEKNDVALFRYGMPVDT